MTKRPLTKAAQGNVRRLNLHDTYTVEWDVTKMSREFLQNFYDSVPASRFNEAIRIKVDRSAQTVALSGPAEFDLDYLLRIGASSKTHQHDEYAGQFGEGFAVATLVIMRDHGVEVTARVSSQLAEFFFDTVTVGGKSVRELCCRIRPIVAAGRAGGNEVTLCHCPASVMQAFEEGRKLFRYDGNPLFGKLLGKTESRGLFIYRSTFAQGAVFYRRQKRADYDLPFILCHDPDLKGISTDRDRSDLQAKDLRKIVGECVNCLGGDVITSIVTEDLQGQWQEGHTFLTALAARWVQLYGYDSRKRIRFPDTYLAKSGEWEADREAKNAGFIVCPTVMGSFGMRTTYEWKEAKSQGKLRDPSRIENQLFKILRDTYAMLLDSPLEGRSYEVFQPEHEDDSYEGLYGDKTLALSERALKGDFSHALAVFLHESLHAYGGDGSRTFSDELTGVVESLCKHRHELDKLEKRWIMIVGQEHGTIESSTDHAALEPPEDVDAEPNSEISARLEKLEGEVAIIMAKLNDVRGRRNPS